MSSESHTPETVSRLAALLDGFVMRVCRRPRAVLTIGLLFVLISIFLASARLQYRTSRDDLMSVHKDYQQRWQRYLAEFGDDDDMVVVVEGERARLRTALEHVANGIRRHPDRFDRLFYKVDLRHLQDRAMLYLSLPEIQTIVAKVETMGVFLGPLAPLAWQGMTLQSMLMQSVGCAEQIANGEPLTPTDRELWQQLPDLLKSAEASIRDPKLYRNPWTGIHPKSSRPDTMSEPQFFESPDGKIAFLLVRPMKETGSFTPAQQAVAQLREIIAETKTQFGDVTFGLTGLPVLEHDEMSATEVDANRAAWLALLGVTLLYLVVYRGIRYPFLTVATLIVGTIWSLGWLTLTVGHLNILSATFAVMLIGMGDYGVLWVARYDAERQDGRDAEEAMRRTSRIAGPSIVTAAATTSLAFFATMFADFQAVTELGWIAGCGVILCAVACITFLPAMMVFLEPYRKKSQESDGEQRASVPMRRPPSKEVWLPALASRPRWVMSGTLIVVIGFGIAAMGLKYDHNLLHMQPKNLESVQWELKLINDTTGASWHALSIADSREEALLIKNKFEQLPDVSRVVEVASLIPDEQESKLAIFRRLQQQLKFLPPQGQSIAHAFPDVDGIKRACRLLMQQLETLPVNERGSEIALLSFVQTLDKTPDHQIVDHISQLEQRMSSDLAGDLHRLRKVTLPRSIGVDDIPIGLRERHIGTSGRYLVRVFAKDCLWDFAPLEQFVNSVRSVDPEATGKPFGTLEGLRSMKAGFQWAGVYALVAIILVLTLDFRRMGHVALALFPLVLGVIIALGVLSLCSIPMNPANLIALPLIVGVGVDNGVHVLHDYRERVIGKQYRLSEPTGRGIMVAALTTMLGFGTLIVGRHQGQSGLGLTLTLGVGCCMIAALVVLPAMLRLIDERRQKKSGDVPSVLRFPDRRAA